MVGMRTTVATLVLAATVLATAACNDDDDGGDGSEGSTPVSSSASSSAERVADDCVERLFERASLNTDNFPTMIVFTDGAPPRDESFGEVECAGLSDAANITYLVGEFPADAASSREVAVSDDFAIVEPGGDAGDRLEDPRTTWSDQEGAAELAADLAADGAVQYELAAPDPDDSPVRLMSSAIDGNGRLWLIWRFADADAAAGSVDTLVSALPTGTEPAGEPAIDGAEVRLDVTQRFGRGDHVDVNPALALADR